MDPTITAAIVTTIGMVLVAIIGLVGIALSRRSKQRGKVPPAASFGGKQYLREPLEILSAKKNPLRIESAFLHWPQCTILLWVHVPAKGVGLRNSPHNRYLLAHHTGEASKENYLYFNQFGLRHSMTRDQWEVLFSNGKVPPEYAKPSLSIGDGLDAGWHQFMIAWDVGKPLLTFTIDGEKGWTNFSKSFRAFWPEKLDEKVTVGAWPSDYWAGHYCETRLAHLWIVDSFSEATGSVVKEHFRLKPRE